MRTNDLKQTWKPTLRHKLMAMVHIASQQLNIEHGSIEYRAWLQNLTGKQSCKDLTDEQLRELIASLRQQGCLERKATEPANASTMTMAQDGDSRSAVRVWQCHDAAIRGFC